MRSPGYGVDSFLGWGIVNYQMLLFLSFLSDLWTVFFSFSLHVPNFHLHSIWYKFLVLVEMCILDVPMSRLNGNDRELNIEDQPLVSTPFYSL